MAGQSDREGEWWEGDEVCGALWDHEVENHSEDRGKLLESFQQRNNVIHLPLSKFCSSYFVEVQEW